MVAVLKLSHLLWTLKQALAMLQMLNECTIVEHNTQTKDVKFADALIRDKKYAAFNMVYFYSCFT